MSTWHGRVLIGSVVEVEEAVSDSPEVDSVTVLGPTSIKVNFVYPALDNVALRNPDNYVIAPTRGVYSVTPEDVTNPTYVILEIDEQKTGENYDVTLTKISAA